MPTHILLGDLENKNDPRAKAIVNEWVIRKLFSLSDLVLYVGNNLNGNGEG